MNMINASLKSGILCLIYRGIHRRTPVSGGFTG